MAHLLIIIVSIIAPVTSVLADELVIYLHNAWYEKHKHGQLHPKFGVYELSAIHSELGRDVDFIAPSREANTDPAEAAQRLVETIRKEIDSGRVSAEIKVVGASKGAYIAMLASQKLQDPEIRWVLLGGCNPKRLSAGSVKLTGRVLSIYESSDTVAGSCPQGTEFSSQTQSFEEVRTDIGNSHGFLFSPHPAWVQPAKAW